MLAAAYLEQTAELEVLLVEPEARRKGIGRALSTHWLAWARQRLAREAVLEVRVSNGGAQALYRTLGFQPGSVRAGYYRHPQEDALLMRKLLHP